MRCTQTHVFFWGGPFSNWFSSAFPGAAALKEMFPLLAAEGVSHPAEDSPLTRKLASHRFLCGEQWMMAVKAWLFSDAVRLDLILKSGNPKEQKALGRDVAPFDPGIWDRASIAVVAAGSIARFAANPSLCSKLLATRGLALVEGSPNDRTWGVGLRWDSPAIEDPRNWRGQNKLGAALEIARATLAVRTG